MESTKSIEIDDYLRSPEMYNEDRKQSKKRKSTHNHSDTEYYDLSKSRLENNSTQFDKV